MSNPTKETGRATDAAKTQYWNIRKKGDSRWAAYALKGSPQLKGGFEATGPHKSLFAALSASENKAEGRN